MENITTKHIQDRFRQEIALLRLERRSKETELTRRQAQFDLRAAREQQTLYRGSLRSFADKLSGKLEERETALRHAAEKAEATLASAKLEKEVLNLQLSDIRARLETLPDWDTLREQAADTASQEWNRLEALYCMEALLPLLEENHAALMELRNMMSGANVGKVYSFSEQAEIQSAPESSGDACKPYVLRLKSALAQLDIPFPSCTYFNDPTAFLISLAAKHNRRDRLNKAIGQVEELQRLLPKLQKQLDI